MIDGDGWILVVGLINTTLQADGSTSGHVTESHNVAILVLYDKLDCFGQLENFFLVKKGLAFIRDQRCHLELMAPYLLERNLN